MSFKSLNGILIIGVLFIYLKLFIRIKYYLKNYIFVV